jgi:hypothetical protein
MFLFAYKGHQPEAREPATACWANIAGTLVNSRAISSSKDICSSRENRNIRMPTAAWMLEIVGKSATVEKPTILDITTHGHKELHKQQRSSIQRPNGKTKNTRNSRIYSREATGTLWK